MAHRIRISETHLKAFFQSPIFHRVFQALTTFLCVLWWFRVPAPGKAILALTIAAVLVTVEGIGGWQRAIWLMLIFALAFLENRAINNDRTQFAKEQREARQRENNSFSDIATGLSKSIGASNAQFQATMSKESQVLDTTKSVGDLARRNLQNVTGGDTYAVVEPFLSQRPDRDVPLSIKNRGTNILTGVSVALYDAGVWMWGTHDSIVHSNENRITGITLHPGERLMLPREINPLQFMKIKENEGEGKDYMYRVFVSIAAQNFTSTEYLDLKQDSDGKWNYTYKIYRQPPIGAKKDGQLVMDCLLERVDWSKDFNNPNGLELGPCVGGVERAPLHSLN